MRIIIVISSLACGGAERVVCRLGQEWSRRHDVVTALFDITYFAYHPVGRVVDLRASTHAKYRGHLVSRLRLFRRRTEALASLFRNERPDLIVSFMESANIPSIAAAVITRDSDRLIVSVRNNPSVLRRHYRMMIPLTYRIPRAVVAPSEGVLGALRGMGLPDSRLAFIPNPVPFEHLRRERDTQPLPTPYVLGVGRLHPQKGFERLVRAFARLDRTDLHLVILGDGEERAHLQCLSRDLAVGSRVHLPGPVADVAVWYRHALCFVLSSRYEGWPNVLLEAMASGCPTVSFDCAYGPSEIVEDGRSGLLVPQDDIAKLASTIARVVTDGSLRDLLAARGVERAATFSVDTIAPRWLQLVASHTTSIQ